MKVKVNKIDTLNKPSVLKILSGLIKIGAIIPAENHATATELKNSESDLS